MIKHFFIFFLVVFTFGLKAQNIVQNPSFETYSSCPDGSSQLYRATSWFNPTFGTPDYFNVCFDTTGWWSYYGFYTPNNIVGYQNPKTGVAYAGFLATYPPVSSTTAFREYVETKLTSPMVAGQKYFINFWVSLSDSSNYATDDIGVALSTDSILNDTTYILYVTPQFENSSTNTISDKLNWTLISGQYIASGGEEFIAIGNFKDDLNTDTIPVGGGGSLSNSDYSGGYYYIDDICISTDSALCATGAGIKENNISTFQLYPNPVQQILTLNIYSEKGFFRVYDSSGQLVCEKCFTSKGEYQFDMSDFINGIYFLQIQDSTEIVNQRFLLIH